MQSHCITISRKVVLSLVAVLVIFLSLEYLILYKIVLPGFATLQTDNATQNAARCHDAITSELNHLAIMAEDWSVWDDSYQFVQDGNKHYIENNIAEETFSEGAFDLIFICNSRGDVVFGTVYDPVKVEKINLAAFPMSGFGNDHLLLKHTSLEDNITGLINTEAGPMMLSSHPIITSQRKGPAKGSLIMGRFLSSAKIKQFSEQVNVDFSISFGKTPKATNESYSIIEKENEKYAVYGNNNGDIRVSHDFDCLDGQTATITSTTPDDIISKGLAITKLSMFFGLGISSISLLSVFLLLKYTLLNRIENICNFFAQITETGDLSARSEVRGNDKLSTLSETINSMLDTLETNEEQITHARIDAERASNTKNLFLANMSHEIRTPMNAIIGFSDLLADEDLPKDQKEYVDAIRDSGKNLLNLINDILDFSKIEAGKLNVELGEFSIEDVFAAVESQMNSLAEKKGLDFAINKANDLPAKICTDTYRLQQCLINLAGNAIKFTEQGHVYINVSVEDRDALAFIRFDIEDTGIGISEEKQLAIFDSFTQEDLSSTRLYGGSGLGLAITRQLAELLGGEISLTSQQGKGSVFSLVLPIGLDPASQFYHDIAKCQYVGKRDRRKPYTGKYSGSILVAEDVKTNQILIELLLNKMGFDVTFAEDGHQAIEKAASQNFDLIFMDIHMPGMNGYQATKVLRKNDTEIPIIALTASILVEDRRKCIDAGCSDYLPKPVDATKLAEVIGRHLRNKQLSYLKGVFI